MRIVTISASRGKNQQISTNASTWGQLVAELQEQSYDLSGMKAIVGGLNITLESADAVLPQNNFTLFLSPVKIKAGASASDYSFEYELDDVEDMNYTKLRTELKSIRTQASELEDEDTLELIGNYTHDTVSQLQDKLTAVYEALTEEKEEENVYVSDATLENRVFELEYALGIVNAENESRFFSRKDAERERVLNSII